MGIYKKDLFKGDKSEVEKKLKKILESDKVDSPVLKNITTFDPSVFDNYKNVPSVWESFISEYEGYNKDNGYGGLWKIIEKYNKYLEGTEQFDQKKALVLYKMAESNAIGKDDLRNSLKDSLKVLDNYNPLNSNNYETISIFATILRKIYENKNIPDNRSETERFEEYSYAKRIAAYLYTKYGDEDSKLSYFLIYLAMCEHGDISFEGLCWEIKFSQYETLEESKDDHVSDIDKIINYVLSENKITQEEMNFDSEDSSTPIFKRVQNLKIKENEKQKKMKNKRKENERKL